MQIRAYGLLAGTTLGAFIGGLNFGSEYINAILGGVAGFAIILFIIDEINDQKKKATEIQNTELLNDLGQPLFDSMRDYGHIDKSGQVTITLEKAYNSERDVGLKSNDPWRLSGRTFFESIDAEISFGATQEHTEIAFEPPWQTLKGFKSLILLELPESLFMNIWEEFVTSNNADIKITVEFGKGNVLDHIKDEANGEFSQLRDGFLKVNRITHQKIITKNVTSQKHEPGNTQ